MPTTRGTDGYRELGTKGEMAVSRLFAARLFASAEFIGQLDDCSLFNANSWPLLVPINAPLMHLNSGMLYLYISPEKVVTLPPASCIRISAAAMSQNFGTDFVSSDIGSIGYISPSLCSINNALTTTDSIDFILNL